MNEHTILPPTLSTAGKPAGKGWPPERRAAQAERIRQTKPWLKATGPKTAAGKKRCSQNAHKRGHHSEQMRQLRQALKAQRQSLAAHREFVKLLNAMSRPAPPASFSSFRTD